MNNDNLGLECMNWIMSNIVPEGILAETERNDLFGRIDSVINPEVEETVSEKTEKHFGESEDTQ